RGAAPRLRAAGDGEGAGPDPERGDPGGAGGGPAERQRRAAGKPGRGGASGAADRRRYSTAHAAPGQQRRAAGAEPRSRGADPHVARLGADRERARAHRQGDRWPRASGRADLRAGGRLRPIRQCKSRARPDRALGRGPGAGRAHQRRQSLPRAAGTDRERRGSRPPARARGRRRNGRRQDRRRLTRAITIQAQSRAMLRAVRSGRTGRFEMTSMKRMRFAAGLGLALLLAQAAGAATIETKARNAIVVDFETGAVLLDKNADQPMPPASMSKIMTAYLVYDALKRGKMSLEDILPVSEKAWRTGGSKMFVPYPGRVKVEDLIRGMIVQSGNDACIVLAEGLAGSEQAFIDQMNEKA